MKALVINCSPGYNLGTHKLRNWLLSQGHNVDYQTGDPGFMAFGYDLVVLSVVFSWHAKIAREIALRVKGNSEVWCGGPGMFALSGWWKKETGLEIIKGIDDRFEYQAGNYKMTFASRGCPVGCYFCIVPKLEGKEFTLNWDFEPAPFLCDNNLSALPIEFQEHIIDKYKKSTIQLKDANSGFEPHTFDIETYRRWKPIMRGPWRFAFDNLEEENEVRRMMQILKDEPERKKRVYVLIGNELIDKCLYRIKRVIEWGGEPHVQPMIALNALEKKPMVRFDWTEVQLLDMARWANRWLWRSVPINEYKPRKNDIKPFGFLS